MGFLTARCSIVQPSTATNADWPETMPPCGAGWKYAMPLARATGISSESGLAAIHDSTSGV